MAEAAIGRRPWRPFAQVRPGEMASVAAAFLLFFFVLGSYFLVRPIRETMAAMLGPRAVADLWLYTALFSIALVPVYGWLVARVRRAVLLPCLYGFVAIVLAAVAIDARGGGPGRTVSAAFYVWISVLNLLLVSAFWSFLLEIFSSEQARRLFGLIAAGGTIGALAGPLFTSLFAARLGTAGILSLAAAGFAGAIGAQCVLMRVAIRDGAGPEPERAPDRALGGNPLAGIAVVARSPYLLGIALFMCLLSAANTLLYFEQIRLVGERFADPIRRTEIFADIDFLVQALTVFSQLFLTGWIARRLGVTVLLVLLPVTMTAGFLLLAFVPAFALVIGLLVLRRWGEYAFSRPGREMLFSTLDTEAKYKAKSFIDVPVYRLADYLGAQAKTALDALTASPKAGLLAGVVLAALWAWNGVRLGRRYDARARA